ncbi:DUF1659 domain-containing protein [Salisediminibacterium selenitireducens]|uniref:DUF1659 domain-containing protein n=1 Tax=Bacillus selenitireducens (strain ATCC 700615 / DSM 15326 / MLS10) TaxID=439292 RepID=D6XY92_BACIE|nr:DUF1659 domain-containing protein [Salisediminibacterium selenitireducens]ADH98165.1 protein of unknown function DUF1659 [[Bacillus] selenitireducens MLS10]
MADMTNTRLSLTFYDGEDEFGQAVSSVRHFNNVDTGASNAALANVAQAIAGLQTRPLIDLNRNNTYQLEQ